MIHRVVAKASATAIAVMMMMAVSVSCQDPPFSDAEMATMFKLFQANLNINNTGGVVAAPDYNTPGGSYYYDWARDEGLAMYALQLTQGYQSSLPWMKAYVNWVNHVHTMADPNVDVRIEPKFNLPDGSPYTGGWCRPQTDGPAIRARTLVVFAQNLIANGQIAFVQQYLYTGDYSKYLGGAIKYDLDWVAQNWQSNGCDLWEEVHSTDFFWNRYLQRRALILGSQLAAQLGDMNTSAIYNTSATAIGKLIPQHYQNGYIQEESSIRPADGATVCAINNGDNNDGLFGPTDPRVANTIAYLNGVFHAEYPINGYDDQNGVPGILYGRYPGDTYGGGNPWILTTNCLAELYYHGAAEVAANGVPSMESLQAWSRVLNITVDVGNVSSLALSRVFLDAGDGVLLRVRYHVAGAGFHLSEQLDKNSGFETSATDLTWSYGTLLKAMYYRSGAVSAIEALL